MWARAVGKEAFKSVKIGLDMRKSGAERGKI